MAKYSFEFKKKIVNAYLNGEGGYMYLTKKYGVKASTPLKDATQTDAGAERVKQLEDENLKLRIENAYLKELRRLRLDEEALLKKQRESSTASEENSN